MGRRHRAAVSTAILMRSIAQIAREEGEDATQPAGALACLEVFALGGEPGEAAIEGGYFAVRAALARSVSESARFLASRGLVGEGAPLIARLVAQIGARFGVVAGEKFAAQAVRWSARSAGRRSISPSPNISKPSRAATSSSGGSNAVTAPKRSSSNFNACAAKRRMRPEADLRLGCRAGAD